MSYSGATDLDSGIAVSFDAVSVVFGPNPDDALRRMDAGEPREEITRNTGQVVGVHRCSLEVHQGETVVLMGLSGSGKSTLLRAVNGLNSIAHGRLLVHDGERFLDIGKATPTQLRWLRLARIAMVFQQFALLPWRSVAENVGLGLELAGMPRDQQKTRVEEQLALVHLSDWAHRPVTELSGGMQQRVGLARAFATQAPILLMDEPFSALDPLIRTNLQDELLALQKRLQKTIIFVSHDLDEALKLGSKIAILRAGRLVQFGSPQDIVLRPIDEHVAQFVAHMNPLNVLRTTEVMRPMLVHESEKITERVAMTTSLRELIRYRISHPGLTAVVDEAGHIVGVIDDVTVYRALLNQHESSF